MVRPASSAISSAQLAIGVRSEDPQQVRGARLGLVPDETSCRNKLRVVRWAVC